MKVIIVGGVAGGASCAARLRRLDEKAEIMLVERGPYVSYANCGLPYHNAGTIPGAVLAPVDELRDRLEELPRDRELLLFCGVGLRGYVAARLLSQHGFQVRNLSGGYKRYQMWLATTGQGA